MRYQYIIGFFVLVLLTSACNINPNDPGKKRGNIAPDTFIAPTPREGSENNPFRIRIQWRGNDPDGRVREYQYRLDGPLFDNTWQSTEYFYQDFKLRKGWYTIQVRSIDDNGTIDETPAGRRFHVLGPTFDKGILVVDDDNTTDDDRDSSKDALMDSLMRRAGYDDYTFWDYEEMFGITETIAFTDKGTDLLGNEYDGFSAYSTVIWYTGTGGENNISKNKGLFVDYLDMGGNLCLSGSLVMMSVLGDTARGNALPEGSFGRRYLKIRQAKAALVKTDLLLGTEAGYPDLSTKYTVGTSGLNIYLDSKVDQLIPTAEGEILYTFSHNVYVDEAVGKAQNVNAEEFAGTPVAVRYKSPLYNSIVFGFPFVYVTKRARRNENNLMDEDTLVEVVRTVLRDEFGESP